MGIESIGSDIAAFTEVNVNILWLGEVDIDILDPRGVCVNNTNSTVVGIDKVGSEEVCINSVGSK